MKTDEMRIAIEDSVDKGFMTEEKGRVWMRRFLIATESGWTDIVQASMDCWEGKPPARLNTSGYEPLPNYPEDLNAMHEAEKALTPEQCYVYQGKLEAIVGDWVPMGGATTWLWHATAAQREDAFIQTISKT